MKRGFTLIELLVVVLIIGILSSIALPQYTKSVEKARAAEAEVHMAAYTQAIDRYNLATRWKKCPSTQLPKDLDITIPQSNKLEYTVYCCTSWCYVAIEQKGKRNWRLYADMDKYWDNQRWHKECQYYTSAGKAVCTGLSKMGYTAIQSY